MILLIKIPIAKPLIGDEEVNEVINVLRSGQLAQGPMVEKFEKAFSEYIGVKESIAVGNGTEALHLALLAAGIKKGDEVIVPSFTFIATANSVLFCNAKPVFADIREDDFNIDPDDIQKKITPRTKAIIPVHLYGQSSDMKAIMDIAEDNNLVVIEDACQAHGAEFNNKKVGSFGIGTFSFYGTKNMTTGEGGMITTNNSEIADKLRMLRQHGMRIRYHHEILGFNFRMTDLQAAIGYWQLKKLDRFNETRIKNAKLLTKGLGGIKGVITPEVMPNRKHVFHQYTIRITKDFKLSRDELVDELKKRGIGVGVYYPIPIHKQKIYRELGYKVNLPITERLTDEILSLPVHPNVSEDDINYIINAFEELSK